MTISSIQLFCVFIVIYLKLKKAVAILIKIYIRYKNNLLIIKIWITTWISKKYRTQRKGTLYAAFATRGRGKTRFYINLTLT